MKFLVGYFTARPGQRDILLEKAAVQAAGTRAEPGCLYFEMVPLPDRPDDILLAECFVDAEAHRLHSETPHQKWFQGELRKYASRVDIYIITDDDPQHVQLTFEPPA